MRVAGDPALQLSWLLMLAWEPVVALSRKLVASRMKLYSFSMLLEIDTTLVRYDTLYVGDHWVCQGRMPLRRRSTTGAPPNPAFLRRRCNCADIGAALNQPTTPYVACVSLKGLCREHAETREYLFVLGDVPSLPASKASIHLEEASCPPDLGARINSEHSGRHSTSRHCGTISYDHEPLNPLRPQRCISLSSATPSPSGHPFRTSPTSLCSPMASQMSGLRHQDRNIKASTDRLCELLRPLVKAYVLGYASSTTPRLLTLLVTLVTRQSKDGEDRKFQRALLSAYRILRGGLELQRFPTFCAALIGGTSLLKVRRSSVFPSPTPRMLSQFG